MQEVIEPIGTSPHVYGKTIEQVKERLVKLSDSTGEAVCFIPAGELSAFIGPKDYQGGIITELTDLLSNNASVDISTKTDGIRKIRYPTISMYAGSTVDWLHSKMPEGTLEGGFYPRFLIVTTKGHNQKFIPSPKYHGTAEDRTAVTKAKQEMPILIRAAVERFKGTPCEFVKLPEAEEQWVHWYFNRHAYFSKNVDAYAQRSRDQILRLAMLMAITRRTANYIDCEDIKFAVDLMYIVGQHLEDILIAPNPETKAGGQILKLLPATKGEIYRTLYKEYRRSIINEALLALTYSNQVSIKGDLIQPKP
jgi:hypothetical protein